MKILLLALMAIFVIVNVGVPFLRKDLNWRTDPMSSYLTGEYGWVVDASYFALAAAIALLPFDLARFGAFAIVCWISAAAVISVVATDRLRQSAATDMQQNLLNLHKLSAGIAFVTVTLLLGIHGWHDQVQFLIALAAPASAVLFARFKPKATAIEERSYAGLAVLGLFVLVSAT